MTGISAPVDATAHTSRRATAPAVEGCRDGATLVVAYVPFALALGAALAATDVDLATAWSSAPLIFGGAAQLLAVQLLSSGAAAPAVVVAALVVNSRHLLYGASLAPHTRGWSRRSRGLAAYFLADPVYALAIGRFEDRDEGAGARLTYYFAMGLTCWVGWLSLTASGALLAGTLPTALPLEFAAPLTFLLLTLPTLKNKPTYAAAAVGGAVAVPAAQLPLGVGLLLATAAGIAAGAATSRRRDE
jgi:predicted branched-subunit amino acid permease